MMLIRTTTGLTAMEIPVSKMPPTPQAGTFRTECPKAGISMKTITTTMAIQKETLLSMQVTGYQATLFKLMATPKAGTSMLTEALTGVIQMALPTTKLPMFIMMITLLTIPMEMFLLMTLPMILQMELLMVLQT
jgi:hypothetical protein